MKKILLSIATIALVGGIGFAATNAFFTDTETSTGNTFTAGTLDLEVSSQCTYNGVTSSQCGKWEQKDLTPASDKFFNFTDVKPGDWGENTIDFKILTNDAWMCANIDITQNSELGKYLNLFWWIDDGDNIYQNTETVLYGGPRTIDEWLTLINPGHTSGQIGALPLTFADSYRNWRTGVGSPNTTPIPGNVTQYLGVGWCFGTLNVTGVTNDAPYGFTCSGAGDQQDAQGKSVVGNLEFTVEQHRNNPSFLCPENRPRI